MERPELVLGSPVYAKFVERINRFVVRCYSDDIGQVDAFMANPGRLGELLIPGADIVLERSEKSATRKTLYSAAGVYSRDTLIGLNTHHSNQIARYLLKNRLVPGLEQVDVIDTEVVHERSRFDFLVLEEGIPLFLEVKSVSLSGNGIAMFPDAVTERGRRHLKELANLGSPGKANIILFIAQGSENDLFMPDYHTDLEFSRTILEERGRLRIVPVGVKWDRSLRLSDCVRLLAIPWDFINERIRDTGSYLLSLRIPKQQHINVGSLGKVSLKPGYYLYVGSGMNGLSGRISRHMRLRKNLHWHVDFLRQFADKVTAYAIRTSHHIETDLAIAAGRILEPVIPGFGASDSALGTHLFYSRTDPYKCKQFQLLLEKFRFIRP
ncbi:MAG: DNA/RNA nuclease SfsA [Chloroflexota bacterium]|nr:DNA/RNA nuclease SfsA [Chloroflexota bacterium]